MSVQSIVRAGGGVVWRVGPDGLEVLLVHRPAYDDWTLPKGKIKADEQEEEAALREVEEETGLKCRLERELGGVSYRDNRGRPKIVRYWLMQPLAGEFRPTDEVDETRWLPLDRAIDTLTYEHDRSLLRMVESGPTSRERHPAGRSSKVASDTTPLYVVRHAKAGMRGGDWDAPDELRPLTEEGFVQAEGLIAALEGYPVGRILSSPYTRCRQSVEPLARRRGLPVEDEDRLAEGTDPDAVQALFREIGSQPAVLCTHGDVVQGVLDGLVREGTVEDGQVRLKKGSAWLLETRRGRVLRATYLPPPSAGGAKA